MTIGKVNHRIIAKPETWPNPIENSARRVRDVPVTTGRTVSSVSAVAGSVALLIFAVFFHRYIAYYDYVTVGNVSKWTNYPILAPSYFSWLPILVATLILFIIGQIVLIRYRTHVVQETVLMALNLFVIAAVLSLYQIFPFDFSAIPNAEMASMLYMATRGALIGVAALIGVETVVRLIKLLVSMSPSAKPDK